MFRSNRTFIGDPFAETEFGSYLPVTGGVPFNRRLPFSPVLPRGPIGPEVVVVAPWTPQFGHAYQQFLGLGFGGGGGFGGVPLQGVPIGFGVETVY